MGLKQLHKRIYCMENELCGAGSAHMNNVFGRASNGRNQNPPSKMDPQLSALTH